MATITPRAFDKKQTLEALETLAEGMADPATVELRYEDGYSWIEFCNSSVGPKSVETIAQKIANATGFRFLLQSCGRGHLEGALDADFGQAGGVGTPYESDSGIESYGDPFMPDMALTQEHRDLMSVRAGARTKAEAGKQALVDAHAVSEQARMLSDNQITDALKCSAGESFSEAISGTMQGGSFNREQIRLAAMAEPGDSMPNMVLDKIKQAGLRVRRSAGANGEALGRMVDMIIIPPQAPAGASLEELAGQAARALMAARGLSKAETLELLVRQLG